MHNMKKIFQKYAKICKNMKKIAKKYAQYAIHSKKCARGMQKYAKKMCIISTKCTICPKNRKICREPNQYAALSICKICKKYAKNVSNVY